MKCKPEDDPFELSIAQARELIKLARFTSKDVFYDLGCATGKVVIEVVKRTGVKKAIGVDHDECQFRKAWPLACRQLPRRKLWYNIDFKLKDIQTFDYSDATILYQGTEEDKKTVREYQKRLGPKPVRIITKDLPLVGYMPARANRENKGCWLFLSEYPLTRTHNLESWIQSVLGRPGTLEQLYRYYRSKLAMHYRDDPKYHEQSVRFLKRLIKKRFRLSRRKGRRGRARPQITGD
jgi:SAM-dependent methyltransferase